MLLPPAPCPKEAVFRCESETTLFGLPKEDTTRNQWLSCIYDTVPEQFNPNISVCVRHIIRRTVSWTWEYPASCAKKGCFYKVWHFNFARTVWRFWLTACKYVFLFKEFATDASNASFELWRVVLVYRFSDHKCRHGNSLQSVIMSLLNATNASFIMGFIIFVSSCWDTASQYGEGRNISVSRLRYSANHNALNSWPIRAHLTFQNDELCKNRRVPERQGIEEQ